MHHAHEFDAGQDVSGRAKGFEVEHRSDHALDGTMVLLHDVVEIFDLTSHRFRSVLVQPEGLLL